MNTQTITESTYSQFVERIKSNQVEKVINKGARLEYVLTSEYQNKKYSTKTPLKIKELLSLLETHGVEYVPSTTQANSTETIVGLLLSAGVLAGTFAWLLKLSNSGGVSLGMNRSQPKYYNQGNTGVGFADVS